MALTWMKTICQMANIIRLPIKSMSIFTSNSFNNVWVLALSNALAASSMTLMMLVGSLIGAKLAPNPDWATLPIALIVVGTALSVIPAARLMDSLGRKNAFRVFMLLGLLGCFLASLSLGSSNFALFCVASMLFGAANAAFQQTRFAAMECVEPEHHATAASVIMCGGILAALIGPELAVYGMNITAVPYQGSFWMVGLCIAVAALLLTFYTPRLVPTAITQATTRPATQLLRNPGFVLALLSGVVAYVVMSFIMTGTPISMHHIHGHSVAETKWVIQSHIAAMFLPSLIAPFLFRKFGVKGMMAIGLVCYCVTITYGYADTTVDGFWVQLVLLGVGWNFLFTAGTSMLPSTYHENDRYKAQAINDVAIFSIQAAASLTAGWALSQFGWQHMLLFCLIPIVFMLIIFLWEHTRSLKVREAY